MDLVSFSFLFFALAAICVLRLRPSLRLRPMILLLLNGLFFASFLPTAADALPVLSMLALGYACILLAQRKPSRLQLASLIFVVLLLFIWLKRYSFITPLLPAPLLMVVGLSYILFRILHLLIDVAQNVRPAPPLLGFLNYCLFFPTFLSGPIARYEQFDDGMKHPPAPLMVEQLHTALCRIALGLLLVVVCSAYASTAVEFIKASHSLATPDHADWIKTAELFSLTSFAVLLKLYTNFSGSMHIVIGLAMLMGFTLPENFNKPYLAKNFLDFWARWHITLSEWIKYYLFNPLLSALTRRYPSSRATTWIGAVAFFVSFFLIGIWHGSTSAFAVFGLMLGSAATINKLWQQGLTRLLGKKAYKVLAQRSWYYQLSRGLTLAYIAIALMCLWIAPDYIARNGAFWFVGIALLSLLMLSMALAALGAIADHLIRFLPRLRLPQSERGMALAMALIAWFLLNHLGAYGSGTPELVYKGF